MAQPEIGGTGKGIPRMFYGSDGSKWIALLVDALGALQVDVSSIPLPTDAATETTLASALTALQSIQNLVGALHDVGLDELDVQVIASALPTDAATQTTLALCLTALQKIDDLQNALGSVATDLLRVESKDGDKLFSFSGVLEEAVENLNLSVGSNNLDGTPVPSGEIWKVLYTAIRYDGTVPTSINSLAKGLAGGIPLIQQLSPVSTRWYFLTEVIYLQEGDYMNANVEGATAGDNLYLRYAGIKMNAP